MLSFFFFVAVFFAPEAKLRPLELPGAEDEERGRNPLSQATGASNAQGEWVLKELCKPGHQGCVVYKEFRTLVEFSF